MSHPIHSLPGLIASARFLSTGGTELAHGDNFFNGAILTTGGAVVTRVVPADVYTLEISLWAGSGGVGEAGGFQSGGRGGFSRITLDVEPGDTVEVWPATSGGRGTDNVSGGLGGWPDGGDGGHGSTTAGGGGGGGSRVYINGVLVAVAGGGGGETGSSGTQGSGGFGGGVVGGINSGTDNVLDPATQTAGGVNITDSERNGSAFQGGHGYTPSTQDRFTEQSGAGPGGGGGGYFGGAGSGGPVANTGGGGGTGWVMPTDGGSNSPLDRDILESETPADGSQAFGTDRRGWEPPYGFTANTDDLVAPLTEGHPGRVFVYAIGEGDDVYLGRQPDDSTYAGTRMCSDTSGTQNVCRWRRYVAPCDMWIDTIHFYTTNSVDSNSPDSGTIDIPWCGFIHTANAAGVPGAMLAATAPQTELATGVTDLPLLQPIYVERGTVLFVGTNFGAGTGTANHTRTESIFVLPSGRSYLLASQNFSAEHSASGYIGPPTTIGFTPSAQTQAYSVWASGMAEKDKAPDYAVAVVRFNTPTSIGTLDVTTTDLGGRVPKGVIIFGGHSPENSTADHVVCAFGIGQQNGNIQFCASANHEDNVDPSDCESEQRIGAIISTGTPGETVAVSQAIRANVDSYITNGVRLNFTTVEGTARQFVAIFFAGEDCDLVAFNKTDWASGANEMDRLFTPTFAVFGGEMSNAGNGEGTNGVFSFGMGFLTGAAAQSSFAVRQANGATTGGLPNAYISNTAFASVCGVSSATPQATIVASAIDADGFTATSSALLSAMDTLILYVRMRGAQAAIHDFATPTSTGAQNYNSLGFDPELAIVFGTTNPSLDTGVYDAIDASGFGYGAYSVNGGGGAGFSAFNQHDADPTNCGMAAGNDIFRIGYNTSPSVVSGAFSFVTGGFSINYSAVHSSAMRASALCIGPA